LIVAAQIRRSCRDHGNASSAGRKIAKHAAVIASGSTTNRTGCVLNSGRYASVQYAR